MQPTLFDHSSAYVSPVTAPAILAEQPRERLAMHGPDALSLAELISVLLRTGLKGDVAGRLIGQYGSLNDLARASLVELQALPGVGPDKAAVLIAAFSLARRLTTEVGREKPMLDTPERVADCMREVFRPLPTETFWLLTLNTRRRLTDRFKVADGTLDTLLVHPREIFRHAIERNAAAIVLAHNHPSGDPSPSEADIKVTRDLIRAGQLLKIEVLDHVIVGERTTDRPKDYSSLRELGYFYN